MATARSKAKQPIAKTVSKAKVGGNKARGKKTATKSATKTRKSATSAQPAPKGNERKATPAKQREAMAEKSTSTKPANGTHVKSSAADPSKKRSSSTPSRGAVEAARKHLRALVEIVEQANDRDAEQILGEGQLEALLKAVLPQRRRSSKTTYDYLASQKRRASLMAQVRHAINGAYSFSTGLDGLVISPTRVQWFYDGLTFIEGTEPFSGVVGLYRNGELRYGLDVKDATANGSLGPSEADFVSLPAAKKSFAAAAKPPRAALLELEQLRENGADQRDPWLALLEHNPWFLGAQHCRLVRLTNQDANMPELFAERVEDGAHDVLLLGQPSASVFGKSGRMQRSFQDTLYQAEQTLSFVQRQAEYLEREYTLSIRRPRVFVIAGRGLSPSERDQLRQYADARHAEVRVLSYDDLAHLAQRTAEFFQQRI